MAWAKTIRTTQHSDWRHHCHVFSKNIIRRLPNSIDMCFFATSLWTLDVLCSRIQRRLLPIQSGPLQRQHVQHWYMHFIRFQLHLHLFIRVSSPGHALLLFVMSAFFDALRIAIIVGGLSFIANANPQMCKKWRSSMNSLFVGLLTSSSFWETIVRSTSFMSFLLTLLFHSSKLKNEYPQLFMRLNEAVLYWCQDKNYIGVYFVSQRWNN
jgi:hypothetical protein